MEEEILLTHNEIQSSNMPGASFKLDLSGKQWQVNCKTASIYFIQDPFEILKNNRNFLLQNITEHSQIFQKILGYSPNVQ